jgi:hypothetical protein
MEASVRSMNCLAGQYRYPESLLVLIAQGLLTLLAVLIRVNFLLVCY